ncbi:MAG: TlyA family RNA methyltransferase [Candidatus Sungbacteria bacterium]|nr:TlyA family RNA methyltransferase [bacterium]MDZ4286152.1 TlyA family RNA methyltransferase [Candidatus Sungbacteria bacterium]
MKKQRLDEYLIEHTFASGKDEAFVIVTEGRVFVEGQKAVSPSQMVMPSGIIEVRSVRPYVGRGAYKLEGALDAFGISPKGLTCVDIGAATGGFTQVLLHKGAAKVYAIDTAKGKLALKLREDPRVVVREETDVRHMEKLQDSVDLVTIDVSLISLRDILPHARRLAGLHAVVVALFKPQYETRDPRLLVHGIVRDDTMRQELINDFLEWLDTHQWKVEKWIESPIRGMEGNKEYLFYLTSIF